MSYIKIDEKTIAKIEEVQTKYDIENTKREIEIVDREIARINERKDELLAILAEATKLGIKTSVDAVEK